MTDQLERLTELLKSIEELTLQLDEEEAKALKEVVKEAYISIEEAKEVNNKVNEEIIKLTMDLEEE